MPATDVTEVPAIPEWGAFRSASGIHMSLPPGSRVAAYVRSTGSQNLDDITLGNNLVTTLAAGLARVRAGFGDTVFVLPGHTENVTSTSPTFLAGTRIIGIPFGTVKPVFTWNATGSNWAANVANLQISGCKLDMSGANGVTKGITATAAGLKLWGNEIVLASGAALKAAIGVSVEAGADDFEFVGNWVHGTETHNVTDGILISAAVVRPRIVRNVMVASATAANGLIRLSAAALRVYIANNDISNSHTASTACIACDTSAAQGLICYNNCATMVGTGTAPAATGVILGAGCLIRCFENYACPTAALSGDIAPARDT